MKLNILNKFFILIKSKKSFNESLALIQSNSESRVSAAECIEIFWRFARPTIFNE